MTRHRNKGDCLDNPQVDHSNYPPDLLEYFHIRRPSHTQVGVVEVPSLGYPGREGPSFLSYSEVESLRMCIL